MKKIQSKIGCNSNDWKQVLTCLQFRTWEELANIGAQLRINQPNWITRPWSPIYDGDFVNKLPNDLWSEPQTTHIPVSLVFKLFGFFFNMKLC